jgi:squalene-associated FAD-dependent desaturase
LVHVVGAGLAGLAAAAQLVRTGAQIAIHDAAGQAGGRCRSYYEPALGMEIDNGNHLVLSGNHATLAYTDLIGTRDRLAGPLHAEFAFVDLASQERWRLQPNEGRLPWWIFSKRRRVPNTSAISYFSILRLLVASRTGSIGETISCSGPLYERLWKPLLLAALNTEPRFASARLAAAVIRETLASGGSACRPLLAEGGLSNAFVNPALHMITKMGGSVQLQHRLRRLYFRDREVAGLDFGDEQIELAPDDRVILAVPPWIAAELLPNLQVPTRHRAILNGHFQIDAPMQSPPLLGVIGGLVQWIFVFPGRISITISSADSLLDTPREKLAALFWHEIEAAIGLSLPLPRWQVIKEKRATFAALASEDAKRPPAVTPWRNLVLAGDFTATGLPATIEGAIRSGFRAAELSRPPRPLQPRLSHD